MVAFSGADPIGVLIGAKRSTATLIHRIAVHPDHRRQGHGRHLLDSLGSKLAILGPPRIVAEVPESSAAASGLFRDCGYVEEAVLTDYVLDGDAPRTWHIAHRTSHVSAGSFVIPVSVDDLAANGLLADDYPQTCWERSVETLTARKDEIVGLAVASDERIEASLLYIKDGAGGEIMSVRSLVEDDGARLRHLLSRLGPGTFRIPKVHPAEVSQECLETLGFRPAGGHFLYAATARNS